MSEGHHGAIMPNGSYTVINKTTGERFENVVVGSGQSDTKQAVASAFAGGHNQSNLQSAFSELRIALETALQDNLQPSKLEDTIGAFREQFSDVASDPDAFHELMSQAFGAEYDVASAETIRQQVLEGDFSWMPDFEVVSAAALDDTSGTQGSGIALAAYDASSDTIYISDELLQGSSEQAVSILTEEVGHALDVRLNTTDTVGDEGELFASLVGGEDLSEAQIAEIKADNDHGTIIVDGKEVQVEYGFLSDVWNGAKDIVGGAVDVLVGGAENLVEGVADVFSGGARLVGDFVTDGFDIFNEEIVSPLLNLIPGGRFVNDHLVQPVFTFLDTSINMGVNTVDSVVSLGENVITGGISLLGDLAVGDIVGARQTLFDTSQEIKEDIVGFFVENFLLGLKGTSQIVNDVFGLTETRGLNADEREYLENIYGDSLDYDEIEIQVAGGLEEMVGIDPHAVGNDIFMPADQFEADGTLTPGGLALLGHEAAHVWQFQNDGADYISEAVESYAIDIIKGEDDEAYNYEKAIDNLTPWEDLTPDQQAELAEVIGMALAAGDGSNLDRELLQAAMVAEDSDNSTREPLTDEQFEYFKEIHTNLLNGTV